MKKNLWVLLDRAYSPVVVFFTSFIIGRFFSVSLLGKLATIYLFVIVGQLIISRGCDQNIQVLIASNLKKLPSDFIKRIVFSRLKNLYIYIYIPIAIFFFDLDFFYYIVLGIFLGSISAISYPYELFSIIKREFNELVIYKFSSAFFSCALAFFLYLLAINNFVILSIFLIAEKICFLLIISKKNKSAISSKENVFIDLPYNNLPVIISSITVFLYNRSDQLYIATYLSKAKLGEYFSVLKFFEIANLLVFAYLSSEMHRLTNKNTPESISQAIQKKIFFSAFILVVLLGLSVTFLVPLIFSIKITEGFYYSMVLSLATIISLIGAIKGPWVAKNNIYHRNSTFTFFGAFFSLAYLYIFKPQTLFFVSIALFIGQFTTNILLPLFFREERDFLKSFFAKV
jgi:O-antigen/teichoic acid export membrane protein